MTTLTAPRQEAGKLINLILKRLVPMLLDATDGDPHAARVLARETVNDYCARNNTDLIAIAQIIACGLASLGNLSLSMAGDLPHALVLRLQAAANALERTAQHNRRVLKQAPPAPSDFSYEPGPDDAALEAAAIIALTQAQQAVAQANAAHGAAKAPAPEDVRDEPCPEEAAAMEATVNAALAEFQQNAAQARAERAATPAPEPAKPDTTAPAPGKAVPDLSDHEKALIWANGMNRVAAEYHASIPHLPPAQRRQASLRVQALSTTASNLIAGTPPDPFLLPKRPKTA